LNWRGAPLSFCVRRLKTTVARTGALEESTM
jgi:hypothetical protein